MTDYVRAFNRFELKYLVHHVQARELVARLGPHVTSDPNAGIGGFYKIVSRYYDSPELRCYWEKRDGEKFRRKVRVRTYGERPAEAFVEIKQRYNQTVQKRRCRLPLEVAERELDAIAAGTYEGGVEPVLDEVFNLCRRQQLGPKLVVSYNRAALFDRYKKDLRITIDRNIRCRHLDLSLAQHRTHGPWAVPPTFVIVEIKFNETLPRWICTVLNALDLQAVRLSKYRAGIERFGLEKRSVVL